MFECENIESNIMQVYAQAVLLFVCFCFPVIVRICADVNASSVPLSNSHVAVSHDAYCCKGGEGAFVIAGMSGASSRR